MKRVGSVTPGLPFNVPHFVKEVTRGGRPRALRTRPTLTHYRAASKPGPVLFLPGGQVLSLLRARSAEGWQGLARTVGMPLGAPPSAGSIVCVACYGTSHGAVFRASTSGS